MSGNQDLSPILLLCAMKQEMAPLRRALSHLPLRFEITGVGLDQAALTTHQKAIGARFIVTTGCCGGLTPGLSPGHLVIPHQVLQAPDTLGTMAVVSAPDPSLVAMAHSKAQLLGLSYTDRPLLTVSKALTTVESKSYAYHHYHAAAVDMETAAIAKVAHEFDIPYLALRIILDSAEEELPEVPGPNTSTSQKLVQVAAWIKQPKALITLASLALRWKTVSQTLSRCLLALLEHC